MITLISGTDRIDSNTFKLTKYIQSLYQDLGQETQIIDLAKVKSDMLSGPYYGGKNQPAELQTWTQMI
ncbi:MAG TPA: NAD(P)H-dependent oxidoreductase, partial [Pseudobdellovibrionaceae bacterium]|nr:NAD(P)H-dependent oxidoreductase [Pseudobdellovibrionaceae bacterium]